MDIRNPRLDEYLSLPERGLTNYLSSKDVNVEDLVVKQEGFDDFYVLLYTFGLKFYDFLSGTSSFGKSEFISREKTIELLPTVTQENFTDMPVPYSGLKKLKVYINK